MLRKGFTKDGNKNRLREQDIHKIVDVFNNQSEIPKYSRMVSVTEIEGNEFNRVGYAGGKLASNDGDRAASGPNGESTPKSFFLRNRPKS